MKIDLHVHSADRSACGRVDDDAMIEHAVSFGLDGLAFTDHNRLVPPERIAELNERHAPFRVFGGIEATVDGEHVVVLGVDDPVLEEGVLTYPELHDLVRAADGWMWLAHPSRFSGCVAVDLDAYPPDAVEIHSVHCHMGRVEKTEELVRRIGCRAICVSDAHFAEYVGIYRIDMQAAPRTVADLVELLREGNWTCDCDTRRRDRHNSEIGCESQHI